MTMRNKSPILGCHQIDEDGVVGVSFQKICTKGAAHGAIKTFRPITENGRPPFLSRRDTSLVTRMIGKRPLYHHGQQCLVDLLDRSVDKHAVGSMPVETLCTKSFLDASPICKYDPDISSLGTRDGLSQDLLEDALNDSVAMCEVYAHLYSTYIRHALDNPDPEPQVDAPDWTRTLTKRQRKLVDRDPATLSLPEGWSLSEAQSLWLMHRSGEPLGDLALMVGQPVETLASICAQFEPA